MVVLVDSKYFGNALRNARRHQHLNIANTARFFNMPARQYRRYERGLDPIPENVLLCLFHRGFCMLKLQNNKSA